MTELKVKPMMDWQQGQLVKVESSTPQKGAKSDGISRFGKPGKIANIHRKSDGTIESLDVKYLSSGETASALDPSLIKPYQHKFLRKSKAGNAEEKKTEEKQDIEKSENLKVTVKQEKKTEEKQDTEKSSEKLATTVEQDAEKCFENLDTTTKQEKKTEEKQEIKATQEPAEKEDNAGLTRQALKFVERRQARRNLSPRSSNRRLRRITKPVAPPKSNAEPETKTDAELESKPEEATLDAELTPTPVTPPKSEQEPETKPEAELESKQEEATLSTETTPTRPTRPPRLTSTPDCMKAYEADKHATTSVPVSTLESTKNYEDAVALSDPVSSSEFMKTYEADKDAVIYVPTDSTAGSTVVNVQATSLPEINFQAIALMCENREIVMGEYQTKIVSESKDLLKGTNTQNDMIFPADENLLNSVPEDEIPMNRSVEEPFPSTPKRSMERKVDTSWTESPCPIYTPKRLLYTDEPSLAKTPPMDITPLPTRRVDGRVMHNTESPSVEIRARVAPRPVSTPPRSGEEAFVSTPRKNNTSSQDATLETLEDTDRSVEMEHNSSLETTLSATSVPTEENTAEENEVTKLSATVKMAKTYLHTLLVGESYSLDTASDSLDTASVEETDRSNSNDYKTLSATQAPTEANTDKETKTAAKPKPERVNYLHTLLVGESYSLDTASDSLDTASVEETDRSNSNHYKKLSATPAPTEANTAKETKTAAKPKPERVNYLHTLLVGDSNSLGTATIEEMDRTHSYDYSTDQTATDDDMDERSTCSEEPPRSKKMERDIQFEFCASDTIAADFRMVAKLLAKSSTLFTGECPSEYPEGCRTKKRFSKRRARKADTVTFVNTWGDSKTSIATETEGLIDISRLKARPKSDRSNGADQYRDCRFAC